jgi:hypothetical protein
LPSEYENLYRIVSRLRWHVSQKEAEYDNDRNTYHFKLSLRSVELSTEVKLAERV